MSRNLGKRGGGSKLARTEMVSIRLDPRLRYLAELAARKQRRTLSSYIESAIEENLKRVSLYNYDYDNYDDTPSIAEESSNLWDVDEADRFANLAFSHLDMLTHGEQILWKLIRENGSLWKGQYNNENRWTWSVRSESLDYDRLRKSWDTFQKVAQGELGKEALPTWYKEKIDVEDLAFSIDASRDEEF